MSTDSCGPRSASTAAFCAIEVTFDVLWLCSFMMAATTGSGPSTQPTRQPVIAYVFDAEPATSTVSFAPGLRRDRVRLAVVEEAAVALVGEQVDAALRGQVVNALELLAR